MNLLYGAPELAPIAVVVWALRARLASARTSEAGYTTETIIVTALLAACALAAVAGIVFKVTQTANSIKTQ